MVVVVYMYLSQSMKETLGFAHRRDNGLVGVTFCGLEGPNGTMGT